MYSVRQSDLSLDSNTQQELGGMEKAPDGGPDVALPEGRTEEKLKEDLGGRSCMDDNPD